MALVVKDRVQVTTATTGTGTLTLGSAVTGFQDFSVIGNGNTTYYTIVSTAGWEVGIGTYTSSGTTLSRDTVLESSNSGNKVDLSGTSNVFVTYPAEKSVDLDTAQTLTNKTIAPASVSDQANTSTGYFDLPAGTTAQRPASPGTGMIRYNTDESKYEVYNGSSWKYLSENSYPISISYLVVAGGGGTNSNSGGGGGGGLLSGTATLTPGQVYTATVGGGGSGNANGSNSVLSGTGITTQTAVGGGKGGWFGNAAGSGGSGGGAYNAGSVGTGTSGQGNSGGTAGSGAFGGGGGGAGAAGSNNTTSGVPGNGGIGVQSSITGAATYYAGGGGGLGSGDNGGVAGTGGSGGGGNGGTPSVAAQNGTDNTGGGAGGNNTGTTSTRNGGSGVVIISIPTAMYTGTTTGSPTVTTSGLNTIIKFTASGTYTA